jgi:hypothetical protein
MPVEFVEPRIHRDEMRKPAKPQPQKLKHKTPKVPSPVETSAPLAPAETIPDEVKILFDPGVE